MNENKLTELELDLLKGCETEAEWNDACDTIIENHDGKYPGDWYQKIIVSGLVGEKMEEFK